jgi:DNA mismatch repair ATPase MutS
MVLTQSIILFTSFIFIIVLTLKTFFFFNKKRLIKKFDEAWGRFAESPYDSETAKLYSLFKKEREIKNFYSIDEETWKDLDLSELFRTINRAVTPIGSQILYDMLKHPVNNPEELKKRESIITFFSENLSVRRDVQCALLALAKIPAKYLAYSLWYPLPDKPGYSFLFYILSALSIWIPVLTLLNFIHWGFILLIFAINSVVYYLYDKRLAEFIVSFKYLNPLIDVAHKIADLLPDEFDELKRELKNELKSARSIGKKVYSLQLEDSTNVFAVYYNIYTLLSITTFFSAIAGLKKNVRAFQRIFEIVGYLDSLISIASYRKQYSNYSRPIFSDTKKFSTNKIFHPLVVNPVPNDFTFGSKCLLTTGSNMSGKSTFLKTLGVNAILAQTFNMCFAASYEAPFLEVLSSIERNEDLVNGKSYYLSEVESILRIINSSKDEGTHLFLIDEIFRGTNSSERTAASIEVLRYLNNQKDFVIVATHDLHLTEILSQAYQNVHFRETMTSAGLYFDYKLHPGKSNSQNAIALLEYVGYPKTIIDGAKKLVVE